MNAILFPLLYGLAGLLFLVAGFFTIRPVRETPQRLGWLTLAAACLFLAAACLYRVYLSTVSPPAGQWELAAPAALVVAGIFAWMSADALGRRSILDHQRETQAQAELGQSQASLSRAPFLFAVKAPDGSYLFANPAYQQFIGKAGQDLIGKNDADFFPRAQATGLRQEEEKVLESRAEKTREEEIRGIDGSRWLRVTRAPLLDEQRNVQRLLVYASDITHQKQTDACLEEWQQGMPALNEALAQLGAVEQTASWEVIAQGARKLANARHVAVWQIAPERSLATLKYAAGKLAETPGAQLKTGDDLVWRTWQNGQATIDNGSHRFAERAPKAQPVQFSAGLSAPLRLNAQVAYVLTLFHDAPGERFSQTQGELVNLYTQYASYLLQSAERSAAHHKDASGWQARYDQLQYRARLEHSMALIATHFINLPPEKVAEGITRSLQTICKIGGVERSYLVLFPPGWSVGQMLPVSYTSDAQARPEEMPDAPFRWCLNRLNQLETVHIPRAADPPPEFEEAGAFLAQRQLKSFTAIPLVANRAVTGFLAFEALRAEVEWPADVLALLKSYGDLFVNLLDNKAAAEAHHQAAEKKNRQILVLEKHAQESALISEMGDLLQASRTADEAYPIIVRYVQQLVPGGSGALYILHDSKDPAEQVAAWGSHPPGVTERELALNECWALRRGRTYSVKDLKTEPVCNHIKEETIASYVCVPLLAQGVAVGVLHLRQHASRPESAPFGDEQQRLSARIGEYIAMPLTNLKLRDELRSQAIRDPLTRLFNRRYMEETLDREIRRANRHNTSVGIIMFDIDRMKPINDRYGHDAGDYVLRTLGRELLRLFRGEDVACRYGGDEFTVVLPEAPLADVWRRAEQLRDAFKRLELVYEGKKIGPLTLSIGVAAYPDHGQTGERVLLACDAASYAAKSEGGDRIMVGHKTE